MRVIDVRNVCEALPAGLGALVRDGRTEETRAGPCLVYPTPVVTVTHCPRQRVLFSAIRDANPFFHLAEAMWMLAGRNDSEFLSRYVQDFGERFAESDGSIHGAYGYRWRRAFLVDQIEAVVERLRLDRGTRQCVLQMWDCGTLTLPVDRGNGDVGEEDVGQRDLTGKWRDRPCNTHCYLRVRYDEVEGVHVLDLTVCCRSNDAVWGAHGANAVHFSVLQEYLAARIGVEVGVMYQVSNNYHVYLPELSRLRARAEGDRHLLTDDELVASLADDRYGGREVRTMSLFDSPDLIDADVQGLCAAVDAQRPRRDDYANDAFPAIETLLLAYSVRFRTDECLELISSCRDALPDWTLACSEWVRRRGVKRRTA